MVSRGKLDGDPRRDEPEEKLPRGRRRGAALLGDDGALDDGALDDGALDDGALDDGALDDGALDDGALDDGAVEEGDGVTVEEGARPSALPADVDGIEAAAEETSEAVQESLVRLSPADLRGGIEALLFSVAEPLTIRALAELFGSSVHEVRAAVEELRQVYIDEDRAFRLEDIAGGVQIQTLSRFDGWIRRFHKKERDRRLSPAALETLAVIAYKQPINKADLEAIRGVGCSPILKTLLDRGLVEITGREDTLGKPLLYGTTGKFLETFGLQSVRDLPQPELLGKAASGATEEDGETGEARRLLEEEPPAIDDDDDDAEGEVDVESATEVQVQAQAFDEEDDDELLDEEESFESSAEGGSGLEGSVDDGLGRN